MLRSIFAVFVVTLCGLSSFAAEPAPLKLLFLGDRGHHQPAARFKQFQPVIAGRKIELVYTENVGDLNADTLGKFDGLLLFANIDEIKPEQAKALLDYVAGGKGFVPLHCASYCFRNNDEVVALMGGQFQRHGTGTFRVSPTDDGAKHPLLQGSKSFESWDETYVHTKHNEKDRIVLEYRNEGEKREPWTWVRTHGKGRVFYTAWGHDERTWGNPGFQNLVERGIRWACGQDVSAVPMFADKPEMTPLAKDVKPFEYVEANVPFYPPGKNWGTLEAGKRTMQLPLSPEESIKHISVPVGFEVSLFASEPMIGGKPICMNWDEAGRLWICETMDYPNELQPQGKGRDRIRILEDTDGDGKADKHHVFAEQLSIPSALTFYRGGALVQDGRETVYLNDTDGDGKADLRKVLVTGWGMGDTHGGVSNFQYGLDNWYYAMQGYNNSSPVLTDGTRAQSFRQGFFRFKVAGEGDKAAVTELEFLRSTNNNTWGLGISEEGLIFGSTANGNPSEFMPIPNRYYESVRGWSASVLNGIADDNHFEPITEKVRQVDHHGGFTAAAGHALYTARNYPQEYWNRTAFVCEPTGHLVATFVIRPDGAGFKSKNSWNLFASNDEWTAPIMAEVGPDGNVWVLDWYNYIVQHNPTPAGFRTGRGAAYESELRDKKHGRVYRVVGKKSTLNAPREDRPHAEREEYYPGQGLTKATPDQLITALHSENLFWRRHAQRLLVERGKKDVVPALAKLVANKDADGIGISAAATHSLWALDGLLAVAEPDAEEAITAALKHQSRSVRRNAVQIVRKGLPAVALPHPALINGLMEDRDPQVRMAAFLAMADASAKDAAIIASALADLSVQQDRQLLDAATSAGAKGGTVFLSEVMTSPDAGFTKAVALERIAIIAQHIARGGTDNPAEWLVAIPNCKPDVAEAILDGFVRGWPKDKPVVFTVAQNKDLVAAFETGTPAIRSRLVTLANRWGNEKLAAHAAEIAKTFLATIEDESKSDNDRGEAATQLITFRKSDAEAAGQLLEQITPRTSPELASALVEAIRQSESPAVGAAIVGKLGVFTPAVKQAAMKTLLSRSEWTGNLLDAVENGTILPGELSLDQKQALATHPSRQIAARAKTLLAKSGGLPNADRQKVLDELLPLTKKAGDAKAGKIVFTKTCAKCHQHSGEGTKVGPDLTGMAVHPKTELLTQIIDPSRSVEGNFRVYTIATADGLVMNGLLASESKTAIDIIDTEGKKQTILREDIEKLIQSTKSLMPEGFEKQVSQQEITDLLEFLTQRGKYLPIPLAKAATIVSTRGMFFDDNGQLERLVFDDWKPKVFEGVPFVLIDPQEDKVKNAVLLYGPQGIKPPTMPRSVTLPCNAPAKAIHLLSGVSGWGFPIGRKGSVTMIVRLKYEDGKTEDHELRNGEHFADYIRRVDVPESKFAYQLRGQQMRYLAVHPQRKENIKEIELEKGPDDTAPVVMAVTVEAP
ncbi:MAG: ThuA domain-containing protein [Pirellulaceae bacterium]|nr:ThuA domain-containing protein [Pirellulaceae bacterium]